MSSTRAQKQPRNRTGPTSRKNFPREYLIDRNASAAARRCGFSPRSSRELGHRLLNDPLIQAQIADLEREMAARAQLNRDALVAEMHAIAYDTKGPPRVRQRALETLLKVEGALVERHEHSTLSPDERKKRIQAIMGAAIARRAAVSTNGNGNGNGHHA